jgi:hypothetical protein
MFCFSEDAGPQNQKSAPFQSGTDSQILPASIPSPVQGEAFVKGWDLSALDKSDEGELALFMAGSPALQMNAYLLNTVVLKLLDPLDFAERTVSGTYLPWKREPISNCVLFTIAALRSVLQQSFTPCKLHSSNGIRLALTNQSTT